MLLGAAQLNGCLILPANRQCTSTGHKLVTLDFSDTDCTDQGIRALATGCRGALVSVSLLGCGMITDAGLVALATCKLLKTLELSGALLHDAGINLTDTGVAAVCAGCPVLQHLTLDGCPDITDTGLAALPRGLQSVSLVFSELVGDPGVMAIARRCPSLASARFGSVKITNAGVIELACVRLGRLKWAPPPCPLCARNRLFSGRVR